MKSEVATKCHHTEICFYIAIILPSKSPIQNLMKKLRRFSIHLWLLLKSLSPVPVERLLMPLVFVCSWIILRSLGTEETVSFVWSIVLAQTVQLWVTLPMTARQQFQRYGSEKRAIHHTFATIFAIIFFQVWWSEPWFSQRSFSILRGLYAAVMLLGVSGDREVIDRFAPVIRNVDVPITVRIHFLKLKAIVLVLFIAINETLIVIDAPLSSRVAVLSVLPIVLHYFFQIVIRLTLPPFESSDI